MEKKEEQTENSQEKGSLYENTEASSKNPSSRNAKKIIFILFIGAILIFSITTISVFLIRYGFRTSLTKNIIKDTKKEFLLEKFKSEDDFKSFYQNSNSFYQNVDLSTLNKQSFDESLGSKLPVGSEQPLNDNESNIYKNEPDKSSPSVSDTNNIYISSKERVFRRKNELIPTEVSNGPSETSDANKESLIKIVNFSSSNDLSIAGELRNSGNLFIFKKVLVVIASDENSITGYDLATPGKPKQIWKLDFDSSASFLDAREYQGKVYLTTELPINKYKPCPVPIGAKQTTLVVDCSEIYHPSVIYPTDSVFSILVINPDNSTVENRVSFVGSSKKTIIEPAKSSIYITYPYHESVADYYLKFFKEDGKTLLNEELPKKFDGLASTKISDYSKLTEMQMDLTNYYNLLSEGDKKRLQNESVKKMASFAKKNIRNFTKTGIVKIDSTNFGIKGSVSLPGSILDQYWLDDYQDNLRVLTNSKDYLFYTDESVNDIYILDNAMSIMGQIIDIGLSQDVGFSRFVEDRGYLATDRAVDPFYIMDLSNPKNPQLLGQIRFSGTSSFLYNIDKNRVLAIGPKDTKTTLNLFDVSNPSLPKVLVAQDLDEPFSEIRSKRPRFYQNESSKILIAVLGNSEFIFSYVGDSLLLNKTLNVENVKNIMFANGKIIVVTQDKVSVYDDKSYENEKEIIL